MDWNLFRCEVIAKMEARLAARPAGMKPCVDEISTSKLLAQCIKEELQHFHNNFEAKFHHQTYLVNQPYIGCFSSAQNNFLVSARYTPMSIDTKFRDFEHCSYLSPMGSALANTPSGGYKATFAINRLPYKYSAKNAVFSFPQSEVLIPDLDYPENNEKKIRMARSKDLDKSERVDGPYMVKRREKTMDAKPDAKPDAKQIHEEEKPEVFIPPTKQNDPDGFQLKEQAVLDNVQDPVFRKLLNSHVLISGPPGTGKTTVQIKRLSQKNKWDFLRPEEQSCIDKSKWDENRNWIFFTPTPLLKGYLKEAIAAELLPATDHHLKVWADYKVELLRRVQILQTSSEAKSKGFKRADRGLNHLKNHTSRSLTEIAKAFITYINQESMLAVDDDKQAELFLKGFSRAFDSFRKSAGARDFYSNSDKVIKSINENRLDSSELSILLFCLLKSIRYLQFQERISRTFNKGVLAGLLLDEKYMVCIDEVTDFPAIDIGSIRLLSSPSTDSLTMSGDLMQRLELKGIESWNELKEVGISHTEFQLERPYRQSGRLTAIARKLKQSSMKSQSAESISVPIQNDDPQVQIARVYDKQDKIGWVSSQILKIVTANHGQLPSIGVLVPSPKDVDPFAESLGEHLYDSSIDVEACATGRVIGDLNKVRVFCIEHIKGVEFDSVIFCDIDQITSEKANLIDKYLYVGLSRSKRHLSISVESFLPAPIEPLRDMLEFCNQIPSNESKTVLALANKNWKTYPDRFECNLQITAEIELLLSKHFSFYANLYIRPQSATTDAQKNFLCAIKEYERCRRLPTEKNAAAFASFLSRKIF